MKGFVFTLDAVFALSAVYLLAFSLLMLYSPAGELQQNALLEKQARDYLRLNYAEGVAVTPATFYQLTNHSVSGTPVEGGNVIRGSLVVYPKLCGCSNPLACTPSKTDACIGSQETLAGSLKEAWIS